MRTDNKLTSIHFTAILDKSRETLLSVWQGFAISEESHNYVNNGSLRLRLRKWILVVKLLNFSRKKMVLFVRSIPIIWFSVTHQFFILSYDDPCVSRDITNTLKVWLGDRRFSPSFAPFAWMEEPGWVSAPVFPELQSKDSNSVNKLQSSKISKGSPPSNFNFWMGL